MTWQLATFTLLGARARASASPGTSARTRRRSVLALVATLAALAALGRIAFAPLPNVKPTTDIVLHRRLRARRRARLRGRRGGARWPPTSFFGQGPWTPWQMAARRLSQ